LIIYTHRPVHNVQTYEYKREFFKYVSLFPGNFLNFHVLTINTPFYAIKLPVQT
jgi:hypothetical protein